MYNYIYCSSIQAIPVKFSYAKLELEYFISFSQQKHINMITEGNSITRTRQIYPGKTLKGKTHQKPPQYRCPKNIKDKTNKEIKA